MAEALTDAFRRLAVPLGRGLGALGVTPNAVTLLTLGLHVAAGALVATGGIGPAALGVAVLAFGFLDVVDGAIARQTGQVTAFGGFLDAWVDRLADSAVLVGLLVLWHGQGDTYGVAGAALALATFPQVAYTRAKAEALGVDGRSGLLTRTVRVLALGVGLLAGLGVVVVWALAIGSLGTAVTRAAKVREALGSGETKAR